MTHVHLLSTHALHSPRRSKCITYFGGPDQLILNLLEFASLCEQQKDRLIPTVQLNAREQWRQWSNELQQIKFQH